MLVIRYLLAVALLLLAMPETKANSDSEPWYFTAHEIQISYRYQEYFGKRLPNPLRPAECFFGKEDFAASYQGKPFAVPCRFIKETKRHLKEFLEKGAARYLFPLDADHAHLAIPSDIWVAKYSKRPGDEILPALLWEPTLVALYHTAEHLTIVDPETGQINPQAKAWQEKRNVVGFYDGRPVVILPPNPMGSGYSEPEGYKAGATFYFLAHRLGELVFSIRGKSVSFDISFDHDLPSSDP